ncbi:hypothetical protein CC1G_09172 [Coprinopsis cinerea okayama7|uniref:F-box domain-containing protein n=1 Tax=Coprinopsis cinerea (strain Okayama-7 / 130 / ATCC MYA-4618 / FGSC 9003) TaxID=240176 RepID=A8P9U0_COPC7|nr:hypothetical protein CC1G_09172 [Coprinopsis cinerea okayama7\|eukprot:XP_001839838.2 hypothetical protein CC1G_09172 [Coprinopsis cinerea okayama7\
MGHYTTRLDVYAHCRPGRPISDQFAQDLASLLERLPRLLILTMHDLIPHGTGSFVLNASPTLEYISWVGTDWRQNWVEFMAGHPNLQSIGAPFVAAPRLFEYPEIERKLEHVTELATRSGYEATQWCEKWLKPGTLRSLRTTSPKFENDALFFGSSDPALATNPFDICGEKLTTLHYCVNDDAHQWVATRDFNVALDRCPNLRRLDLTYTSWFLRPAEFKHKPSITTFGIQKFGNLKQEQAQTMFSLALEAKASWLPSLQVVQFIDEENVTKLRYFFNDDLESKFRQLEIALMSYDGTEFSTSRTTQTGHDNFFTR